MWIADSDFKAPQPVVDALVARMQQGVYGYTPISERLKKQEQDGRKNVSGGTWIRNGLNLFRALLPD